MFFKILAASLLVFVFSKQNMTNYTYDFPAELGEQSNSGEIDRTGMDYVERPSYYEHLHPIGWSKDGKLAVLLWSNGEFNWSWRVKVLDLDNDRVLYEDDRNAESPSIITKEQVKAKWNRNSESIDENLNAFSVIPHSDFKLQKFPAAFQTDSGAVSFDISIWNIEDTTVTSNAIITKSYVNLLMKFDGKEYSKRIYSDTLVYAWDFYCEGFIKSPYENRIAVLLKADFPGQHFSEPNSSVDYIITGATLDTRFRLKKK